MEIKLLRRDTTPRANTERPMMLRLPKSIVEAALTRELMMNVIGRIIAAPHNETTLRLNTDYEIKRLIVRKYFRTTTLRFAQRRMRLSL